MENQQPNIQINVSNGQQNAGVPNGMYMPPVANQSAALVWCFFLGTLGAHDFYAGNTAKGVIKLILTLTCVLAIVSWVWWLVDIIKILKGTYTDKYGRTLNPNAAKSTKTIVCILLVLPLLVLPAGIVCAIAVPKLGAMTAKSKASEVGPALGEYIILQDAYISEMKRAGSWREIGYSMSNTANFTYVELPVPAPVKAMAAIANIDFNDCPAGTAFAVGMVADDSEMSQKNCMIIDGISGNPVSADVEAACKDLVPSFARLCQ